jgi:hypothetical protein
MSRRTCLGSSFRNGSRARRTPPMEEAQRCAGSAIVRHPARTARQVIAHPQQHRAGRDGGSHQGHGEPPYRRALAGGRRAGALWGCAGVDVGGSAVVASMVRSAAPCVAPASSSKTPEGGQILARASTRGSLASGPGSCGCRNRRRGWSCRPRLSRSTPKPELLRARRAMSSRRRA